MTNKIDIDRQDYYPFFVRTELIERTRSRLIEISELGMEDTISENFSYSFGIPNVMSGLYIEMVWNLSDEVWASYIDWVKDLILKKS